MVREKMVTRTIVSFEAKVFGINLVDGTAVTSEYEISGNFKDNADMLKFIKRTMTMNSLSMRQSQASKQRKSCSE